MNIGAFMVLLGFIESAEYIYGYLSQPLPFTHYVLSGVCSLAPLEWNGLSSDLSYSIAAWLAHPSAFHLSQVTPQFLLSFGKYVRAKTYLVGGCIVLLPFEPGWVVIASVNPRITLLRQIPGIAHSTK